MAKLFISYRRSDSQHAVDRLYAGLAGYVANPKRDIFMDVDNIPLGVDFVEHLSTKVGECEILLCVIGPSWLAEIQRRAEDPKDFVRIEIEAALARKIPLVPIFLDGTLMPDEAELPASIRALSRRNGIELRRASFDANVEKLARGLRLGETAISSTPEQQDDAEEDEEDWDDVAEIVAEILQTAGEPDTNCLLYTSPSPRDKRQSRMPSSA